MSGLANTLTISTVSADRQPTSVCAWTMYLPALLPFICCVVSPVFQMKLLKPLPASNTTFSPAQTLVSVPKLIVGADATFTRTDAIF